MPEKPKGLLLKTKQEKEKKKNQTPYLKSILAYSLVSR